MDSPIFVGLKGTVAAIDRGSGSTMWTTKLKGGDFVTVVLQDGDLFAASQGRLYRLDPGTGDVLWTNELPGLGYGIVSIAGTPAAGLAARRRAAAAAAGG